MISPSSKVICVRTALWLENGDEVSSVAGPIKDYVYTVEAVCDRFQSPGLRLKGFPYWWDASEFRELTAEEEEQAELTEWVGNLSP